MLGWQQHSFGHEGKTRRSRRAEPTPVWSCWRGVSALCDITQGRNPEQFFSSSQMHAEKCCKEKKRLDAPPVRGFQWQDRNHFRKHKWEEAFMSPSPLAFCLLFSFSHAFRCNSNTNWPQSCHAFLCIYFRDVWRGGFGQRNLKKG